MGSEEGTHQPSLPLVGCQLSVLVLALDVEVDVVADLMKESRAEYVVADYRPAEGFGKMRLTYAVEVDLDRSLLSLPRALVAAAVQSSFRLMSALLLGGQVGYVGENDRSESGQHRWLDAGQKAFGRSDNARWILP